MLSRQVKFNPRETPPNYFTSIERETINLSSKAQAKLP
jgi:hypothetical protein